MTGVWGVEGATVHVCACGGEGVGGPGWLAGWLAGGGHIMRKHSHEWLVVVTVGDTHAMPDDLITLWLVPPPTHPGVAARFATLWRSSPPQQSPGCSLQRPAPSSRCRCRSRSSARGRGRAAEPGLTGAAAGGGTHGVRTRPACQIKGHQW